MERGMKPITEPTWIEETLKGLSFAQVIEQILVIQISRNSEGDF